MRSKSPIALDYASKQKRNPKPLAYGYLIDTLMAGSFLIVGIANRGGIALMFMLLLGPDYWEGLGAVALFAWLAYLLLLASFGFRVSCDRAGEVLNLAALASFFLSWTIFAIYAINVIEQFLYLSAPFLLFGLLSTLRTLSVLLRKRR